MEEQTLDVVDGGPHADVCHPEASAKHGAHARRTTARSRVGLAKDVLLALRGGGGDVAGEPVDVGDDARVRHQRLHAAARVVVVRKVSHVRQRAAVLHCDQLLRAPGRRAAE